MTSPPALQRRRTQGGRCSLTGLPTLHSHCTSRPARVIERDDYVIVIGVLTSEQREQLMLTHVEQHSQGHGCVWVAKEQRDAD